MNHYNKNEKMEENENTTKVKGGKSIIMEGRIILWIVIGILFIAVLFLVFKVSSLTGNAVVGSDGKLDTTGWTENEKMNYEMHGTVPARVKGGVSQASSGSGMVGGC